MLDVFVESSNGSWIRDTIGKPAYFSYEIDENLKCLNSETTAGRLYLALLYFKTATLDKDLFLEMNGYEICVEILKTCWQNCQYSDIEFNIILKFFENRCPDLEIPWSNYAGSEEQMFRTATYGSNPHHLSIFPKEFKPLPEFLLSQTNEINCDQKYQLDSDSMKLCESDIPNISNIDDKLNMGEGKTSVILIIFSEILADGKQIARINCLEPLMGVMRELLRNKDQSTQLKTKRQQKLELLYLIDEFKFFDILDESDEILRHGKELNYTLGSAKPLDGGPIRWEIPFLLFKIIFFAKCSGETLKHASQSDDCPVVFQENFRPVSGIGGGSPLVRFIEHDYFIKNIRPDLSRKLCEILLPRIDEKKTKIIDDEGENYGSYEDFIEGKCLFEAEDKIIKFLKEKHQDRLNSLLLAKAWLSHELLYHVMSYRYRVEYGLSEKREKEIAIPFRGKDLPSENSEFSHPDIMIGFTILSYLYRGLDLQQVKDGLIKLKNDRKQDGDSLLKQWVQENKNWIDEQIQKENEQFPECFVQYYLSNFTFPNDTKYYEKKLTGNAHTLAGEGQTKGFSGTDDRNDTMPESIVAKRLPTQEGTNGKLLHILSREVNKKYQSEIEISSAVKLLDQVCEYAKQNKDCYILIDAGAIITEMSNFDVCKSLIKKIDERNEEYLPLSTCHIDNKKLFVYLDEVHTRGTDLKLPLTARGIVTLGKNMNKDKLMQAVMRLRDLDFKQSVILWGSKEISAEIAIINGIKIDDIT
ncbi:unnamed protein product, partial [Rotaria sordida]